MKGVQVACSWSGGKDSCLALYSVVQLGAVPRTLLTIFDESGERSRSHGLHREVLLAQATSMNLCLRSRRASWETYEPQFQDALQELRKQGIEDVVFGDIDLQPHRDWEERVCAAQSVRAHLPLWKQNRRAVLRRVWAAGIRCRIIAVDAARLSEDILGAELTPKLARDLEAKGIDACGENGEFHTVVVDGPMFAHALELTFGATVLRGGYLAIDARLAPTHAERAEVTPGESLG